MIRMMLALRCVLLAALAAFSFSTPSRADEAALYEAAKAEGEVVWYTGLIQKTLIRPMVDAFEAKYPGISVTIAGGTSPDLLLKVLNEAKAGVYTADLITPARIDKLKQADLLATYEPEVARDFPAEFKDAGGQWTSLLLYVYGTAINTELVKADEEPDSPEDYLDPRWKGKIAWASMLTPVTGPGFAAAIFQRMGEEKGSEYLKKLAAQNMISVPTNQRVVLDQLIAGQYPVALLMFQHHVYTSAEKGAPVKWIPTDPVIKATEEIVLLKHAPHPNAGKLLLEFVLSEEGAKIISDANYTPARPGAKSKMPPVEKTSAGLPPVIYGPEEGDAELDEWISTYSKYFR